MFPLKATFPGFFGTLDEKNAQWESNPHFRHGKAAGYRYIMGAIDCQIVKDQLRPRRGLPSPGNRQWPVRD